MIRPIILLCTILFLHGRPLSATSYSSYESSSLSYQKLYQLLSEQKYAHVDAYVRKNQLSIRELEEIARNSSNEPFKRAVTATKNIRKLPDISSKMDPIFFSIALFAETSAEKYTNSGIFYWQKNIFGLEIEVDPHTKQLFIHLPSNRRNRLGAGNQKLVLKTILYDINRPKLMAYAKTEFFIESEISAMRLLQNTPHVLSGVGFLSHTDPITGNLIRGIVTEICTVGSLSDAINKGYRFSLKQKLQIAYDCLCGIEAIHKKGLVHRDVHSRNFFITYKGRKICALIGDMGRTTPILFAKGLPAQGNAYFIPPEGIYEEEMEGRDYIRSDLFAYAVSMWKLFYNKMPKWSYPRYPRMEELSRRERYDLFCRDIYSEARNPPPYRLEKITSKLRKLLIKWTDPDPKRRGDTTQAKNDFKKLLQKNR